MSALDRVVTTILYSNVKLNWETGTFDTSCLCDNYYYFELLTEDNTIDIESIEELDECNFEHNNTISQQELWFIEKVNELVQAVKQLNKEVKEISQKS